MLFQTKSLVLRNVKFGETSIISTHYTKRFGLQSFLVQGARTSRKGGIKANYFQIGQFLDLTIYHKEGKNLQRIKEVSLPPQMAILKQHIVQQSVAQFCTELVLRCVQEEEENESLFNFLEDRFIALYAEEQHKLANFPILFLIDFAAEIGFGITTKQDKNAQYFNTMEGCFTDNEKDLYALNLTESILLAKLLKDKELATNSEVRKSILEGLIQYLKLQLPQMQEIRSLAILHEIISD